MPSLSQLRRIRPRQGALGLALAALFLSPACTVGPDYKRPAAPVPAAYKENANWPAAQPSDSTLRGKWWEVFGDQSLNALEEQVTVSNQTLKAAQAQFLQARAAVRFSRAAFFPVLTVSPAAARSRESGTQPFAGPFSKGVTANDFTIPFDASYEADVWGRVRRTVEAARAGAQASAADVETVSLSLHAELALDYFQAHSLDAEMQLLNSTVSSYTKALELTESRYKGGVASQVDVAQAKTQLETTRAQAIDLLVARAQLEHAIAALIGKPASEFTLPVVALSERPPAIPLGLPSQLLERRPDVAGAERHMAAANANIGIARSAYFPAINLGVTGGFNSAMITTLIQGPSSFWSVGAAAVETLFEGGQRRAVSEQARAAYDQTVASYRQTALTAFQEVEDNLAALRILEQEAATQHGAVEAAEHSLALSNTRYRGGVTSYLEVTTAQSTALSDERAAVQIQGRRMTACVLLIKALGGGWDSAALRNVVANKPAGTPAAP
ncbi:MAG TPA: efflux transporter outer membrane subunit [Candidatus Acidoferrales bacterium]|nr:efflux transporter outer membrane subunit [Candidatus Acidoferrales bacterium]